MSRNDESPSTYPLKPGFSSFGSQNLLLLNVSGGVNLLVNVVVILKFCNMFIVYFCF